jgi:lipopolysaccharide biosynthesis glycosyltransferase
MHKSIYIGFDPREVSAFAIARNSILRQLTQPISIHGLVLGDLQQRGLYKRPIEIRTRVTTHEDQGSGPLPKIMWDTLSEAPMSTQHANARFLVPHLAKSGWALFMDGDMLVRGDLAEVFKDLDESKAVYCVQHKHEPATGTKMDGQLQLAYARKNWSSFCIFNCDHVANNALTLDVINNAPGRDLHRFFWLADCDIGALDPKWNFLVGHSDPKIDPVVVHHTSGTPDMPGYENVAYASEWRDELQRWAMEG